MTNTATSAQTLPLAEKAQQFMPLAQELIDLCDKTQRTIVLCYIKAICQMADEREEKNLREQFAREDAEREQAWANWYAECEKEGW